MQKGKAAGAAEEAAVAGGELYVTVLLPERHACIHHHAARLPRRGMHFLFWHVCGISATGASLQSVYTVHEAKFNI